MFEPYQFKNLMLTRIRNISRRVLLVLRVLCKVTVLLFVIVLGAVRADRSSQSDVRLFAFTSEFCMPIAPGCLYGLMASDGSRNRISIYWIEPDLFCDHTFFLSCSDFIFGDERIHYWIYGMAHPVVLDVSVKPTDQLLPRDVSVESVARSALAIANRIKSEPRNEDTALEVGKFFRQSRNKADYSYEVPLEEPISKEAVGSHASDTQILNALPFGRKYSKQTQADGSLIWRAQRVLNGPHVARVTVKPLSDITANDTASVFDPDTLGRWTLIPESYRAYWSFDRAYSELKDRPDGRVAGRELYDKIESYLVSNKTPDKARLALNQLRFKTAILTGDLSHISRSAHTVVATLCDDISASSYQRLLELARIDARIREQHPAEADDLVRPLVEQTIKHVGPDAPRSLEEFMRTIESNKWFRYGKLLVEGVRNQTLLEDDVAERLDARLETARLAGELPPFDPCEAIPSVRRYLAQIHADPPKGTLTMDDIRDILRKGLEKPCVEASIDSRDELVENTVRSIRLIVGDGPFRGDKAKLIESISKFSELYLVVFKYTEPIDTVLATFLALSFCDTSTPDDHDALFSQVCGLCGEFESQTNHMLAERGLCELVTRADIELLFNHYELRFCHYIDDPVWPAFKFPLTASEETSLRNKLKLRFSQLEPLFEEMALKVKHGGVSDELKRKTCYEIASATLQFLPQAAFLRKPSYPGVSCQHQGEHGFAVVIRGPLYVEGERPREKFKAMKYFHMGHRLEEVVKRERELAQR